MKIERINTGVCHWRATHGQPAMFVNWIQDEENKYFFSSIRSSIERVKNQLIKRQKQ
ncbi:MAG: hypothetical protein LBL58_13835 [Tannerellaceae bacterium]|jgi:hypothetical protein|nr:hypothetical protein [Tannerellaceae bacterium]